MLLHRGPTLADIASAYSGTDKNANSADGHCYIDEFYEEAFRAYRYKPISLLEIGIASGESLLMWADYFSTGQIVGIDRDRKSLGFLPHASNSERISVICEDAYKYGLCLITGLFR